MRPLIFCRGRRLLLVVLLLLLHFVNVANGFLVVPKQRGDYDFGFTSARLGLQKESLPSSTVTITGSRRRGPAVSRIRSTTISSSSSDIIVENDEAMAAGSAFHDDGRHDEDLEKLVNFFRGEDGEKYHNLYTPRKRRRGNVELPTGWGKTGLALKLVATMATTSSPYYSYSPSTETSAASLKKQQQQEQPINTVLYVTPRLNLADQMLDHADQMKIFEGTIPHEQRLIVASKTNRTEMRTTDPKQIAKFLHYEDSNNNNQQLPLQLIVCTYQSLPKIAEALKLLPQQQQDNENARKIGLAVFDEAHVMGGVGKISGFGISDDNIHIDYRLFLTATPRIFTQQPQEVKVIGSRVRRTSDQSLHLLSLHEHHDHEEEEGERFRRRSDVRSFDNPKLFGSTVVRRSLRESIDTGRTVPLKLCVVDRLEISRLAGVRIEDTTHWTPEEMLPFVLKAGMKKTNATRVVSFHPRNIDAQLFVQRAQKVFRDQDGDGNDNKEEDSATIIKDINGKMHPSEREAVLKSIESASGRSVIANCKVMAIGVDKSYLDMVFLTHPIQSREMIRQMIGRVSRLHPNKECAYVLVPAIFGGTEDSHNDDGDDEDDGSSLYSSRSYQTFLTVLQVLAEDNPTVRRDFVFVSEKSDRLGRPLELSEYPDSLLELFMPPSSWTKQETELLMNNLIREVGLQSDVLWDKVYGLLLDYKDKNGDCNVPQRHKEQGVTLGRWLAKQRQLKGKGQLLDVRESKLEEAGVVWKPTQAIWEAWFNLLQQYHAREGDALVPKRHVEDGKQLGSWVDRQRQMKKKGKLEQDQIRRLEQLGFVWEVLDDAWEEWFKLLQQYSVREGDCLVPRGYVEEGKMLGVWVATQRQMKKKGKLEQDKIRRLEQLGFVWEALGDLGDIWDEWFKLLQQYHVREGNSIVPIKHVEEGKKLGVWVGEQRRKKKAGKLEENKIRRLDQLGFVWDVWEEWFKLLQQYRAREGHCNVPYNHVEEGKNLGTWALKQRQLKKKGKLDEDKISRLEQLGFVWEVLDDAWEEWFQLLEQYRVREGDCNVPQQHVEEGKCLGRWVSRQRKSKKGGKLEQDKIRRLEQLGFVWEPSKK